MLSASKTSGPSGYNLTNSLRFRSSASAYLSRTPASASNRKTWTWSGWIKLGIISVNMETLFIAQGQTAIYVNDGTNYSFRVNGAAGSDLITNLMPRDPASWYHLVVACDTTQATDTNRLKIYVNGVQQTSFQAGSAYPTLNGDTYVNSTAAHYIGRRVWNSDQQYDGYLTEVNFIDGQALTPSSFGSTNSTTGVWQPKQYTGTYGTNGFYLNFSNIALTSGSNTGLGKDYSGNGNYWNTNNISVTSGTTYDAMTDVPTLTSATVANYAVMNPLGYTAGTTATLSSGNLNFSGTGYGSKSATLSLPSSGKYYAEFQITSTPENGPAELIGIASSSNPDTINRAYASNGQYFNGTSFVTFGSAWSINDIIGVAMDVTNSQLSFYKNNILQGSTQTYAFTTDDTTSIRSRNSGTSTFVANFGQRPFTYTPPTGFVALNTYNLPTSTIVQGNKYMDATAYTGNGSSNTIVNAGAFQPDLVWVKSRSSVQGHGLYNPLMSGYVLDSSSTGAQAGVTPITNNSNGFTMPDAVYNNNAVTYVGWQWQAGKGTSSTNTAGSITSTVSVNTTAGFSIVTWTSDGFAGVKTMGHGLGVAPKFIIAKDRTTTSLWWVYHTSLASDNKYLQLQSTAAVTDASPTQIWSTSSTTFGIRQSALANNGDACVAYCWAEISGFSKFTSYTGNGSADGSFIFCNFQPRYVMIKRTDAASNWNIYDGARNTYNATDILIAANNANADASPYPIDFLSNGIKLRSTLADINASGGSYIIACFASNPFKNALAR